MENNTWFHADDFGVTVEQSQRILECHKNGALNSISVLPNTTALGDSLRLLDEADRDAQAVRRVLHLNFVEGKPVSEPEKVPLLVDATGYFDKSFIDFFKWNYTKRGRSRKELSEQLKLEIAAQLRNVTDKYNYRITAIDSHQHYHMIPVIFDSLMEVLSDKEFAHLDIRYIRIPVDPLSPILHDRVMLKGVPIINWVKWCILKLYSKRNKNILDKRGIKSPVFFGIFYTCEMKAEVVTRLLSAYKAYADGKGEELELMFHPGNLTASYQLLDERSKELSQFYMSDNRFYEAECLKLLKY